MFKTILIITFISKSISTSYTSDLETIDSALPYKHNYSEYPSSYSNFFDLQGEVDSNKVLKAFLTKNIELKNGSKVNISCEQLIDFLLVLSDQGSEKAQITLYPFLNKRIGSLDLVDHERAARLFNMMSCLTKGAMLKTEALNSIKSDPSRALKQLIEAAHCGDEEARKKVSILLKIPKKFSVKFTKSYVLQVSNEYKEINYGIPLDGIAAYLLSQNKNGLAKEMYIAAADLGVVNSQLNLGLLLQDEGNTQEAKKWYLKAAQQGQAQAQFNLGLLLQNEGNILEAKKWYLKAANNKHINAQFNLGVLSDREGNTQEAKKWYLKAAQQGQAQAQFNLGFLLQKEGNILEAKELFIQAANNKHISAQFNLGISSDRKGNTQEAKDWYLKAANNKHIDAQFNLGFLSDREGNTQEAKKWYLKAAQQGQAQAQLNLGFLLQKEGNTQEAKKWYLKAAQQGQAQARLNLSFLLQKEGNIQEAKKWYLKAAQQGYATAQFSLGFLLQDEGNTQEAKDWYLKAAQQGYAIAQFNLGFLLQDEGNTQEAKDWYLKAAQQGYATAQFSLGLLLQKEGNTQEAKDWYLKAAQQGYAAAQFSLGLLLQKEGNTQEAKDWYLKTAQQGQAQAQFNLGFLLQDEGNTQEAKDWYLKAAQQGYAQAQFNLGTLSNREGNTQEAKDWYLKAAQQGYATAQFNLGILSNREGNTQEAKDWYLKAAQQGYATAQFNLARLHLMDQQESVSKNDLTIDIIYWFKEAAARGCHLATLELGIYYIKLDRLKEALLYLERAEHLGFAQAKEYLQMVDSIQTANDAERKQEEIQQLENNIHKPFEDMKTEEVISPIGQSLFSTKSVKQDFSNTKASLEQDDLSNSKSLKEYYDCQNYRFNRGKKNYREEFKRLRDERKEQKISSTGLNDRSIETLYNIKKKQPIDFKDLISLTEDPYFEDTVFINKTSFGFEFVAYDPRTNRSVTASTHRKHRARQTLDDQKPWLNDIRNIFIHVLNL